MGPTEILPGSQYYRCDHDLENFNRGHIPNLSSQISGWATIPQAFTCRAGTIMVMHYDLWHRALKCTKESSSRLMLKFVAYRTKKPGSHILKYNTGMTPCVFFRISKSELQVYSRKGIKDMLLSNEMMKSERLGADRRGDASERHREHGRKTNGNKLWTKLL